MMKPLVAKLPWIFLAFSIVGFLIYCYMPVPLEVEMVVASRGSILITVNEDGQTRIREKYVISTPVSGNLLRLQLHAGDTVIQQQTELARIQPTAPSLLDLRAKAESKARMHGALAGVQQSESVLARAKEAMELAGHHFDRAKRLIDTNAIAQSEYDEAEHHLRIAEADVRSAESAWKVAGYELELAKAAAIQFEFADTADGTDTVDIFRLISPISGKVLKVFQEDSRVVPAGTPLFELGDPQDLEMVIDVLSSDATRIQSGAKVIVEHWGVGSSLEGVVRSVEPSAFLKISALGVEERRVHVIADLVTAKESYSTLGDGFRIEARIVVASTSNQVLKVPTASLFTEKGTWRVYRVVNGFAEACAVTLGTTNGTESELKSGIREGDLIIVHPSDKLRSGVHVRKAQIRP